MIELYELLDNLKISLDNSDEIKNIEKSLTAIKNNKELLKKIEEYNKTHDVKIRDDILSYEEIRDYKHNEATVNFLILNINNILKEITKGSKRHENN